VQDAIQRTRGRPSERTAWTERWSRAGYEPIRAGGVARLAHPERGIHGSCAWAEGRCAAERESADALRHLLVRCLGDDRFMDTDAALSGSLLDEPSVRNPPGLRLDL
jgi:hypothetical protein